MRVGRATAYVAITLAVAAEVLFVVAWVHDSRNRETVRASTFLWPACMLFLAEAMRMSGRAGGKERRLRMARRLQIAIERDEPESGTDRLLDEADLLLAPILLCLLPAAALGWAIHLLST